MLKKIVVVALSATLFVSCKSKSAFNFNQELVAKENSMIPVVNAAESSITEFYNAGNFDSVYAVSDRLEKYVQSKIDEVGIMKIPGVKEVDNFKTAYVKSFKALKNIYSNYKAVSIAKSDEDRQKLLEDLEKLVKDKNEAVKDMQVAQRKYASENGFKIQ